MFARFLFLIATIATSCTKVSAVSSNQFLSVNNSKTDSVLSSETSIDSSNQLSSFVSKPVSSNYESVMSSNVSESSINIEEAKNNGIIRLQDDYIMGSFSMDGQKSYLVSSKNQLNGLIKNNASKEIIDLLSSLPSYFFDCYNLVVTCEITTYFIDEPIAFKEAYIKDDIASIVYQENPNEQTSMYPASRNFIDFLLVGKNKTISSIDVCVYHGRTQTSQNTEHYVTYL